MSGIAGSTASRPLPASFDETAFEAFLKNRGRAGLARRAPSRGVQLAEDLVVADREGRRMAADRYSRVEARRASISREEPVDPPDSQALGRTERALRRRHRTGERDFEPIGRFVDLARSDLPRPADRRSRPSRLGSKIPLPGRPPRQARLFLGLARRVLDRGDFPVRPQGGQARAAAFLLDRIGERGERRPRAYLGRA